MVWKKSEEVLKMALTKAVDSCKLSSRIGKLTAERLEPETKKRNMKTFSAKPQELERKWYVIDAENKVLGQVAVEAANLLRGKNKTIFTPHVDCGDHVIVVNADKVVLTGNKETAKIYTRYSGYVGGKKVDTPRKLRVRRPELMVELAVKGMVPHTRLGRAQMTKLNVYASPTHPHEAQQPIIHNI